MKQQVDFDWVGGDVSIQRAVALEPGNPEVVRSAGFSAAILGRFDEALRLTRQAVDLDPLNAKSWEILGETKLDAGQADEAIEDLKRAVELNPDLWNGHIFLSEIYILQGRPQDALPEIERVRLDSTRVSLYAIAYHALGRKNESDAALNELISKYHKGSEYVIAGVYAFREESDKAFEWLDRAYVQRNSGLILTRVDPLLKNLRHDPRYAALLKKLNLPN
jgi:tetratricopeptide (TPR) repeat protein